MSIFSPLRRLVRKTGFDIVPYPIPWSGASLEHERKARFLEHLQIDLVLDVGANCGQYATKLRQYGYTGRIISFEPIKEAYDILCQKSTDDSLWTAQHMALGDESGESTINVSANLVSSSLMEVTDAHTELDADARAVRQETITVKTLDEIADTLGLSGARTFLKMDVQGFEAKVFAGANGTLPQIDLLEMELSLTETYHGETLFRDMWDQMVAKGYELAMVDPAVADPRTGQVVQVNAIFCKPSAIGK